MNRTKTLGRQRIKSESSLGFILYENSELNRLRQQPDLRTQVTEEKKNERQGSLFFYVILMFTGYKKLLKTNFFLTYFERHTQQQGSF